MSWYAEALGFPFTASKGPIQTHEKQLYTIIPPSLNFTVGTIQSDRKRSTGICQKKTCPLDC